ncbi:MAG: signal peptide peptidase SppA [Bacteroidota bacterium]
MRFFSTLIASTLGTFVALGVLVFFLFVFSFAVVASGDSTPPVRSGSVLVMELGGPLPELVADDPFLEAFGDGAPYDLLDVKSALAKAAADDRIDGVWLQFRGLSTSWAVREELRDALLRYKESGKPLIASSDDFPMLEGDYYLASTADSVYAQPDAFFEFNGFSIVAEFYKGLLDRLEVEPTIVRAGDFKSAVEPFLRTDLSDENRAQLSELVTTTHEAFLTAVAESRDLPRARLDELMQTSPPITSNDALEAALIDDLLFPDQVARRMLTLIGQDEEERLRTVSLSTYKRISPSQAGLDVGTDGQIAVVYGVGTIQSGSSTGPSLTGGSALGADTFVDAMREARTSNQVDAVVVRINSGGGSNTASDLMRHAIAETALEKPVIVSMGGVAASGGYLAAIAADTIVANPMTITGSIGVFLLGFSLEPFFEEQVGITFDEVTTSPYADLFASLDGFDESERVLMERSVEDTYQGFLRAVAEARGMSMSEVEAVASGRVWTGTAAQKEGLVDVLGSLRTAVELAAEAADLEPNSYQLRVLPRPKTALEQFAEGFSAQTRRAWLRLITTPAERQLLERGRLVESILAKRNTVQAWLPTEYEIR